MLDKPAAAKASSFLTDYSRRHGIYMKINYFNADHTHALIDLPTKYSVEEVIKLLKGGSSYWINHSRIIRSKFAWGVGYGGFSVSHFRRWARRSIYRESGGASSQAQLFRRVRDVC